ncbi:cochlin [Nerophis ophidion]|uniref:cochlin n=1 Tax=Nerophis ophidion TaxID=159077 RepID=UPI002AE07534|nr:cochlin [Nerophis ophidion]
MQMRLRSAALHLHLLHPPLLIQGAEMCLLLLTGAYLLVWSCCSATTPPTPQSLTCETRVADLAQDATLVRCPPHCGQRRLSVFGTHVYATISSLCAAALHSGAVGVSGGVVKVERLPGRQPYTRSYANGIQSQALSRWSSSFRVSEHVQQPSDVITLQHIISDTNAAAATKLPAAKKALKKLSVKKVVGGGNKECQVDMCMVVDSSTNIGQRRFNLQKKFVSKLAAMLKVGPAGPHVGLVQTSDVPRTEFLLTNYTNSKDLQFAIKELTHLGGHTNTGKAIMHATQTLFAQESGGRRGHPRVMLVLIDGWPSDDLERAATLARESGINVFLVSVAKPAPDEVAMVPDYDFAKKAVCKNNGFFNHHMTSWFSTTKHVKPLAQRLCSLDHLLCSRTCFNSVNIGFLIDGSSSIGDPNFRLVLDFLAAIATKFDVSDVGAHVGAVQFTYDQRLEFGMWEHASRDGVLGALRRIPYMSGGTATGSAITYAAQNLFRPTGRGRNFLIVVTDGQSYDNVGVPALSAQNQGITMYSVGVAWAPLDDLKSMASEPKESHTFFTREFTGLAELVDPVVRGICQDFGVKN